MVQPIRCIHSMPLCWESSFGPAALQTPGQRTDMFFEYEAKLHLSGTKLDGVAQGCDQEQALVFVTRAHSFAIEPVKTDIFSWRPILRDPNDERGA